MGCLRALLLAAGWLSLRGDAAPRMECPGQLSMQGLGNISLVPTGWADKEGPAKLAVHGGDRISVHMTGRVYFASYCTPGSYDREQYLALDLRGRTLKYSVDLSRAGCGCNAALYLVSMRQNERLSACGDYYCDANEVCGEGCAEIDIQEANLYAWHSTLHGARDHGGLGMGYGGGGAQWNGPRDWSAGDFGPGGRCIDTAAPFEVAVSFPMDAAGTLKAMDVTLTQGRCPLSLSIGSYVAMDELDAALAAGMTPVVSYWNSDDMLWMDGKGADGQGPCTVDLPDKCAESVTFSGFSVSPGFPATTPHSTTAPPGKGGDGWAWAVVGAFMCGILSVLAVQGLAVLAVWAVKKHRSRHGGGTLPRISSLLSVASSQSLISMTAAEGGKGSKTDT